MGGTGIDPAARADEDRRAPLVREVPGERGIMNTVPGYRCAPCPPLLSSLLSQVNRGAHSA